MVVGGGWALVSEGKRASSKVLHELEMVCAKLVPLGCRMESVAPTAGVTDWNWKQVVT